MNLPDYVNIVQGGGASEAASMYQEINPTLETDVRLAGINALLSEIGFKCGFSNGAFVFNEKSGVVTATQVEADQQRTIQLIADNRHQLQNCLEGLIYALDKFADLYNLAPSGSYKVEYNFSDILYSYEEDKLNWWKYVLAGKVPAWMYFVKFEGMTEEEAKAMQAEMDAAQPSLFEEE
jgi:A118 family predicted phage portal protein